MGDAVESVSVEEEEAEECREYRDGGDDEGDEDECDERAADANEGEYDSVFDS